MPDEYETEGDGNNPELNATLDNALDEVFKGGSSNLDRNRKVITMDSRQYASVLQQALHAIKEDADYRQQLRIARWLSEEDWGSWCNALAECKRYGAPTGWLIDRLIAKSAGVEGGLLKAIFETISHTTFTTNNTMNQKRGFFRFMKGKNDNRQSPISQ